MNAPLKDPQVKEYLAEITKREDTGGQNFDKAVMTLAGGALALSIAFMRDIVQSPRPGTSAYLVAGWASLCTSLLCITIAMGCARWACIKEMQKIHAGKWDTKWPPNWFAISSEILSVVSGLTLVAGFALLACFAALNLGK